MAFTKHTVTGDIRTIVGDDAAFDSVTADLIPSPSRSLIHDPGVGSYVVERTPVTVATDGTFTIPDILDSSETGLSYVLRVIPSSGGKQLASRRSAPFTVDADGRLDQLPFDDPTLSDAVKQAAFADAQVAGLLADTESQAYEAMLAVVPDVTGLAPKASPAFTGNPTAPTPAADDDSTQVATTAFVNAASDGIVAAQVNDAGSDTRAALVANFVGQTDPSTTNKRILSRSAPVFDASFVYSKISSVQDGAFVWSGMNISAGASTPTYFKCVGGTVTHSGPGNLDVFWSSVTHSGAREAGLFIGDITSSGGGNAYGSHVVLTASTSAPAFVVGHFAEFTLNVTPATSYGFSIVNNGPASMSAAINIDAKNWTGTSTGSRFGVGINVDASAASSSSTFLVLRGSWANGINLKGNSIAESGTLTFYNNKAIYWQDSGGTARPVFNVSSDNNVYMMAPASASQWLFRDSTNATTLARITSSGRADFSTGGVTSAYTSGGTQPGYTVNGHIRVWTDGSGSSYLVVDANGASKKVQIT